MRQVGLNRLHNLESEAVIYDVPRERLTTFFLYLSLSLFCLRCPEWVKMMDLGCVNVVRDFDSTSKEEINVLHIWIGRLSNADAWKFGLWLFVRPCLVPLCSAVTLYISHQMLMLEAKSGASIHQSLSEMIVALLWCLYLSFRSHGVDEWGGGGL